MSTRTKSVFSDPDVVSELSSLHDNYVVVPTDKASNNIVLICKALLQLFIKRAWYQFYTK